MRVIAVIAVSSLIALLFEKLIESGIAFSSFHWGYSIWINSVSGQAIAGGVLADSLVRGDCCGFLWFSAAQREH